MAFAIILINLVPSTFEEDKKEGENKKLIERRVTAPSFTDRTDSE